MSTDSLKKFRRSHKWEKFRHSLILDRTVNGKVICEYCHKPILEKYDIIAHHVIELTEANFKDAEISLNPKNIMLIHLDCHNQIHERFGYSKQNVYILWGSPGAGKTTYALNNMSQYDLIIDIDRIYKMFNPHHFKPNAIKPLVFETWYDLHPKIADRLGTWRNCYVISCLPNKIKREELAEKLSAELIHIDTPKEICKERIMNDPNRQFNLHNELEYLEEYWEDLIV